MSSCDYKINLIMVGDTYSGKTSLARKYCYDNYDFSYYFDSTIGVDFSSKLFNKDNKIFKNSYMGYCRTRKI